jgi:hypothetical protein
MSRQRQKHNKQIQRSTKNKQDPQDTPAGQRILFNHPLEVEIPWTGSARHNAVLNKGHMFKDGEMRGLTMVNYTKMTQLFGLVTRTTDNDTSHMHTLEFEGLVFASIEIQVATFFVSPYCPCWTLKVPYFLSSTHKIGWSKFTTACILGDGLKLSPPEISLWGLLGNITPWDLAREQQELGWFKQRFCRLDIARFNFKPHLSIWWDAFCQLLSFNVVGLMLFFSVIPCVLLHAPFVHLINQLCYILLDWNLEWGNRFQTTIPRT